MKNLIGKEKRSILSNVLHGVNMIVLTVLLIFLVSRNETHLKDQQAIQQGITSIHQSFEEHAKQDSI